MRRQKITDHGYVESTFFTKGLSCDYVYKGDPQWYLKRNKAQDAAAAVRCGRPMEEHERIEEDPEP